MTQTKRKFGEIAVRAGFVTEGVVQKALDHQKEIAARGGKHKLLGIIMLEMGFLTNAQLIHILKELAQQ